MKIRRKKNSRKTAGRSARRGVFLDRPGEFLALFSATAESGGANRQPVRVSKRGVGSWRKLGGMGFCIFLILFLASMKVHGWGWAEEAFDFWKFGPGTEDRPISALSEDGLLDAVVSSRWADRLVEGRRKEAAILLDSWVDEETLSSPARRAVSILKWLTSLEPDDNGDGKGLVLSILKDDSRLPRQLDFWEQNRSEIRAVVAKLIDRNVPESLGQRIYHRIDALQNRAYLYLGDIRELKREIVEAIEADRAHSLYQMLEEFRKRHPDVGGTEELRADLEILEAVRNSVREGRMDQARRIRDGHSFVSEVVARKAARISVSEEIRDSFEEDMSAQPGTPEETPLLSSRSRPSEAAKSLSPRSVRLSDLEIRKPSNQSSALVLFAGEDGGGQ
jgi:hypothetical protein